MSIKDLNTLSIQRSKHKTRNQVHQTVIGSAFVTADKRTSNAYVSRAEIQEMMKSYKKKIKKIKRGATGIGPDSLLNNWNWLVGR